MLKMYSLFFHILLSELVGDFWSQKLAGDKQGGASDNLWRIIGFINPPTGKWSGSKGKSKVGQNILIGDGNLIQFFANH